MDRVEEATAEAGPHKRVKLTGQSYSEGMAQLLVGLRTAANGFVRQCTSTNIAHQLALTPFNIEAMEAEMVREVLAMERAMSCVVSCYDFQAPLLDRVMRVYATVKMMNREMARRHTTSTETSESSSASTLGTDDNNDSQHHSKHEPRHRATTARDTLRPRWLIISDENFQVVCTFDPVELPALAQLNFSNSAVALKQKLTTSVHLPSQSPAELDIVAFQHVVYQLDLEPHLDAAWSRVTELLGVPNTRWMPEAELRYLSSKGDSSPHTDTEIEVAEV